jgi:RNA polymerase sigma-70 factor (ECF subfamily)
MKNDMRSSFTAFKASNASGISESEAVRLAQEGDAGGFERLYQLHCGRVYGLCLQMVKDPVEAEDLAHDAFLRAFRKIQTFQGNSLFSTWLHRLTVNVVLMSFRKKKHPQVSLDESFDSDDEARRPSVEFTAPDLNLIGVIDRINLESAISQLPSGCKKMFVLHDIEGYEHHEISRILGCTVGNSKSQLHKARVRLRQLLPRPFAAAN